MMLRGLGGEQITASRLETDLSVAKLGPHVGWLEDRQPPVLISANIDQQPLRVSELSLSDLLAAFTASR